YGWCGRGIALRAKGLGANVIVTEVDPIKAVEAVMDGFQVMKMDDASKIGDIFVTATGNKDVIKKEHFLNMKDGVILANAGHFNVEVAMESLEKLAVKKFHARPNIDGYVLPNGKTIFVIAEGRLVNLAAGDGHPIEIMDISFSLQVLSLLFLSKNHENMEKKVHILPSKIDKEVASLKLKTMNIEIDTLTEEQRRYLEGWQ
ncbi:TPA: adenosylhomocysteinase, partial [Candidatus Micrarchaeota archaeon]|nr:adenosylhomocysteinase [Candidatus Micrarchaeota archaeon]